MAFVLGLCVALLVLIPFAFVSFLLMLFIRGNPGVALTAVGMFALLGFACCFFVPASVQIGCAVGVALGCAAGIIAGRLSTPAEPH